MARLGRAQPNVPIVVRSTLQDPPQETTPAPVIVTAPVRPRPAAVIIARSTLEDFATPPPLVVVPVAKRPLLAPPIILRASLEDPVPPVVGEPTPAPLVVTAPPVIRAGRVLVVQTGGTIATPAPGTLTVSGGPLAALTASGQAASTLTASGI